MKGFAVPLLRTAFLKTSGGILGGGFWFFLVGFRCLGFFLIGKGSSVALQSSQELCGM